MKRLSAVLAACVFAASILGACTVTEPGHESDVQSNLEQTTQLDVTEAVTEEVTEAPTEEPTTEEPTEAQPQYSTDVSDYVYTATEKSLPFGGEFLITGEGRSSGNSPNRIPQLSIKSTDAERINKEIHSDFDGVLSDYVEAAAQHPLGRVDYVCYLNDNVLSLVIENRSVDTPNSYFKVYNLDVITGKELNGGEIASMCDIDAYDSEDELYAQIDEIFDKMKANGGANMTSIVEKARSDTFAQENLDKFRFFFNGERHLTAAYRYAGVAGAADYGNIAVLSAVKKKV